MLYKLNKKKLCASCSKNYIFVMPLFLFIHFSSLQSKALPKSENIVESLYANMTLGIRDNNQLESLKIWFLYQSLNKAFKQHQFETLFASNLWLLASQSGLCPKGLNMDERGLWYVAAYNYVLKFRQDYSQSFIDAQEEGHFRRVLYSDSYTSKKERDGLRLAKNRCPKWVRGRLAAEFYSEIEKIKDDIDEDLFYLLLRVLVLKKIYYSQSIHIENKRILEHKIQMLHHQVLQDFPKIKDGVLKHFDLEGRFSSLLAEKNPSQWALLGKDEQIILFTKLQKKLKFAESLAFIKEMVLHYAKLEDGFAVERWLQLLPLEDQKQIEIIKKEIWEGGLAIELTKLSPKGGFLNKSYMYWHLAEEEFQKGLIYNGLQYLGRCFEYSQYGMNPSLLEEGCQQSFRNRLERFELDEQVEAVIDHFPRRIRGDSFSELVWHSFLIGDKSSLKNIKTRKLNKKMSSKDRRVFERLSSQSYLNKAPVLQLLNVTEVYLAKLELIPLPWQKLHIDRVSFLAKKLRSHPRKSQRLRQAILLADKFLEPWRKATEQSQIVQTMFHSEELSLGTISIEHHLKAPWPYKPHEVPFVQAGKPLNIDFTFDSHKVGAQRYGFRFTL